MESIKIVTCVVEKKQYGIIDYFEADIVTASELLSVWYADAGA